MQRLEIQVLRARHLKSANVPHGFERLFATLVYIEANVECENTRSRNPRSRNPISTIIVSGCTAYQRRSGVHDARFSFKIFRHLSLSLYLWTYVRSSFYSEILSAMLVYVGLRRALCPLLVIRSTVLLFLRPLLSHTLFLVCTHVTFVIMQSKSQVLFCGLRKFRVNLWSQ